MNLILDMYHLTMVKCNPCIMVICLTFIGLVRTSRAVEFLWSLLNCSSTLKILQFVLNDLLIILLFSRTFNRRKVITFFFFDNQEKNDNFFSIIFYFLHPWNHPSSCSIGLWNVVPNSWLKPSFPNWDGGIIR